MNTIVLVIVIKVIVFWGGYLFSYPKEIFKIKLKHILIYNLAGFLKKLT